MSIAWGYCVYSSLTMNIIAARFCAARVFTRVVLSLLQQKHLVRAFIQHPVQRLNSSLVPLHFKFYNLTDEPSLQVELLTFWKWRRESIKLKRGWNVEGGTLISSPPYSCFWSIFHFAVALMFLGGVVPGAAGGEIKCLDRLGVLVFSTLKRPEHRRHAYSWRAGDPQGGAAWWRKEKDKNNRLRKVHSD